MSSDRQATSPPGTPTRQRWPFWVVGTLLVSGVLVAGYSIFGPKRNPGLGDVPPLGRTTETIAPGIHMLAGIGPSAAYAVETDAGLVLVDSGLERDAGPVKAQLEALGLDWRNVVAIFLTHAHGDHTGGAQRLRTATRARVYAGAGDASVLRAGQPREAFFSTFHMPNHSPSPTDVDVDLKGGEVIDLGGARFRAMALPGHTPGSVCYLMERAGLRVLFSGDVIMQFTGPSAVGTYSAYLAPRYRGDARPYLKSLKELRALPVPDLLLPGHPGSDQTAQSPRVTQDRWAEMLDSATRDLEKLLARYEADGANFLDGIPKRLRPDLYYFGDFHGSAVYGFVSSSKLFLVDAPGGPGLAEFVVERQKQLGLTPTPPSVILLTACGERETAGLAEVVAKWHPIVVAHPGGRASVQAVCPPDTTILTPEELDARGWAKLTAIPLGGRGVTPMAYILPSSGKTVLFSGRIPVLFDNQSMEGLTADLASSKQGPTLLLKSIEDLAPVRPDLWLPSIASDGQNANLYDDQWDGIMNNNKSFIEMMLRKRENAKAAPPVIGL